MLSSIFDEARLKNALSNFLVALVGKSDRVTDLELKALNPRLMRDARCEAHVRAAGSMRCFSSTLARHLASRVSTTAQRLASRVRVRVRCR